MTKQVIFYTQGLRYEVEPTEGRQLLLGASEKAQVYLPQQEEDIRLKADGDEVFLPVWGGDRPLDRWTGTESNPFLP